MPWNTVYIRGRGDFQKAVISKLERTWLQGSPEAKRDLVMFWLPATNTLRSLKVAIGSKLIWKYRLLFITNLNSHLKPKKDMSREFSISETDMISKMTQLDTVQHNITRTGT